MFIVKSLKAGLEKTKLNSAKTTVKTILLLMRPAYLNEASEHASPRAARILSE
jgi:hypothetical protein